MTPIPVLVAAHQYCRCGPVRLTANTFLLPMWGGLSASTPGGHYPPHRLVGSRHTSRLRRACSRKIQKRKSSSTDRRFERERFLRDLQDLAHPLERYAAFFRPP